MKKLQFLVGSWAGEARLLLAEGGPVTLAQTEDAQYKLDGLILCIEGIGRTKRDGKAALHALAIISYDDETDRYRMRAFNDGRFMEAEVNLLDNVRGITWGFDLGQVRTYSVLRINETGDWTELTQLSIGSEPPTNFLELTVSPKK